MLHTLNTLHHYTCAGNDQGILQLHDTWFATQSTTPKGALRDLTMRARKACVSYRNDDGGRVRLHLTGFVQGQCIEAPASARLFRMQTRRLGLEAFDGLRRDDVALLKDLDIGRAKNPQLRSVVALYTPPRSRSGKRIPVLLLTFALEGRSGTRALDRLKVHASEFFHRFAVTGLDGRWDFHGLSAARTMFDGLCDMEFWWDTPRGRLETASRKLLTQEQILRQWSAGRIQVTPLRRGR